MDTQSVLYMDKTLEAEILELLPDSGMEDFSHFARHLFRLGVISEREHQTEKAEVSKSVCI